ncbi:MAG: hypothetical protein APR54_12525 [Candidatus Cloacimonas sp. SDB]|nr:MAG: hypothetical protein APR54_12525 [Candidatus Cloacimonas sp. SDB]
MVIEIISQKLTSKSYLNIVKENILSTDSDKILICSAFVRKKVIALIENELRNISEKVKIFVGIRNSVTSVQALDKLLDLGLELYAVDTSKKSNEILHSKKKFE